MASNLKNTSHGESLATNLASNLRNSSFADVKIICSDGSAWAHRLILAAVSPVLKNLLLSVDHDDVATLYLPQLSRGHLALVLDYVYRGRMYIKASQLQHVLGVIEVLSLECGVSVSKKVKEEDEAAWVEEAVFTSFNDKGLGEVCKNLEEDSESETSISWRAESRLKSDYNHGDAVEVKPTVERETRSLRNSAANDDDDDFAVVEVECDSDSDEDQEHYECHGGVKKTELHQCIMCSKVFQHGENLRIHIQSHLGAKAQLRSCQRCKKNFRTALEHELHVLSHSYVRHLKTVGGSHVGKTSGTPRDLTALAKARSLVRASVKRLLPKPQQQNQQHQKIVVESLPPTLSSSNPMRDSKKVVAAKKTVKKVATSTTTKPLPTQKAIAAIKRRQNGQSSADAQKKEDLAWQSCKLKIKIPMVRCDDSLQKAKPGKKRKVVETSPTVTAPKAKKVKKSPVMKSPRAPTMSKKQTLEESLTCPTCDKVFMAKSIFERHLQKSKHGMFTADKDVMSAPLVVSQAIDKAAAEGRQLPHFNQVVQPKIEVGGRTVNKYECHLCKQVFIRVKDLAKHRERMMCSAWH